MVTNTDAVRQRIGSILMSDAAQRIDFYLDNIHVDGSGLSFVALALLSKPQGAQGLSILIGGLPSGAAALYDPTINAYRFSSANYGLTPFERMTILHESVHAWRDTLGRRVPTRTGPVVTRPASDEASAYVAGALFFLFDQGPVSASDTTPSWASGIYDTALNIALQILQEPNPKGGDVKNVNSVGLETLKDRIRRTMTHPAVPFGWNGLRL